MHLEILSEDRSGSEAMFALLRNYQRHRKVSFTYAIRPHRGKGYLPKAPDRPARRNALGLQDLLPAKARAYARVMNPARNALIVLMDSDERPWQEIEDELDHVLSAEATPLPYVIALCVEELEAWLLGDPDAVLAAYPKADRQCLKSYRQDSICGTWEHLARCVRPDIAEKIIRIGYPAVGGYKLEWCRAIAEHMDPDRNRSPSFRRFLTRLDGVLQHA